MFKYLLISSLLLSTASTSFAEISISENISPSVKSLVNPDIQRLESPPTLNNMKLSEFGQGISGWGTDPMGAEKRLNNIIKKDVEKLKTQELTLEMMQT